MLELLMAISALVIAVVALGVEWSTTWYYAATVKRMESRLLRCEELLTEKTPSSLKAAVDDLVGDLAALRASNRKELGSLWARLGGKSKDDTLRGDLAAVGDEELDELLRFQQSHTGAKQ